jgi:hypothetical protein
VKHACQKVDSLAPTQPCKEVAVHSVELYDRALDIRADVWLCSAHTQEYNVKAAQLRARRPRTTTKFS